MEYKKTTFYKNEHSFSYIHFDVNECSKSLTNQEDIASVYQYKMKMFLDKVVNFTKAELINSVQKEPALITGNRNEFIVDYFYDVYTAGLVEYICQYYNIQKPDWINKKQFFLSKPVFLGKSAALKQYMLASTPTSMRRRNLFCGEINLPLFKVKQHV